MSWWENLTRAAFSQRVRVETLRMQAEAKIGVITTDLHAHNLAKWRQRKGRAALAAFNRGARWGKKPK